MVTNKKKNGVTKVISLKKVLANRANAKKSTGPVTFEGKQTYQEMLLRML